MASFLQCQGHDLVALLRGACSGEELARVLACPFLMAGPEARLEPAGAWPVSPELRRLEPARARILEGLDPVEAVPAERALELGLLERILSPDALQEAGEALQAELTARRDEAQLVEILAVIQRALDGAPLARALELEAEGFLRLARRRFGPVVAPAEEPPSPRLSTDAGSLPAGGSGWGNFPPAASPADRGGPLRLERDGQVATLLLDDPPRNEMNAAFFGALARQVTRLSGGPAPSGMVLRGVGRHFSSGADLEELGRRLAVESDPRVSRFLADNLRTFQTLAGLPFGTVGAVGGCCLGSGFELALACGQRLASDNAVFALPEVQYGLMPGCGGTVRLARLVGRARAIRLILSGRSIMASEAHSLGLVSAVLPRKELFREAHALAAGAA